MRLIRDLVAVEVVGHSEVGKVKEVVALVVGSVEEVGDTSCPLNSLRPMRQSDTSLAGVGNLMMLRTTLFRYHRSHLTVF